MVLACSLELSCLRRLGALSAAPPSTSPPTLLTVGDEEPLLVDQPAADPEHDQLLKLKKELLTFVIHMETEAKNSIMVQAWPLHNIFL